MFVPSINSLAPKTTYLEDKKSEMIGTSRNSSRLEGGGIN